MRWENQTSDLPFRIVDNSSLNGYFAGFYLQDEWKPFEQLTINFGGRIDIAKTIKTESQFSPRINIVYTPGRRRLSMPVTRAILPRRPWKMSIKVQSRSLLARPTNPPSHSIRR